MVRLDVGCAVAAAGFHNIRVESALNKELDFLAGSARLLDDLTLSLFERANELLSDDLALLLRLAHALQRGEEVFGGVHGDELDAGGLDEIMFDLLGLALAQQTVVHEHAGELLADGLMHQSRRDGGVDAAGQAADHLGVADLLADFLEKDCEISVGIQNTNNLRKLEAAVNKAEQAMQQDKLAYYGRNGQERQLKGLNEKLERTLTQKRDTEHFLRVLAPKYRSVYVVNLQDDSVRPIIIPDFFQKILDTSGGSFRAVITAYRDQYVVPESRDAFNSVLDYSFVRSKVLSGEIVEVHYTRTDGAPYTLKITPYSSSGSHIHETIWIFADDTATLTPPPTQIKKTIVTA